MKPHEPLQTIIDPFVKSFGGELVADLSEKSANLPRSLLRSPSSWNRGKIWIAFDTAT